MKIWTFCSFPWRVLGKDRHRQKGRSNRHQRSSSSLIDHLYLLLHKIEKKLMQKLRLFFLCPEPFSTSQYTSIWQWMTSITWYNKHLPLCIIYSLCVCLLSDVFCVGRSTVKEIFPDQLFMYWMRRMNEYIITSKVKVPTDTKTLRTFLRLRRFKHPPTIDGWTISILKLRILMKAFL